MTNPLSTTRKPTLRTVGFLALLATGSVGCVSGSASSSFQYERPEGSSSYEIVNAEIREIETSHPTALEVIRDLRPSWLRVRSPQGTTGANAPVVYLDGVRFGGLNNLYDIATRNVENMVFVRGLDATTRFGTGHGGGVIEISSR